MSASRFIGSFTPQEPLLGERITAALALMFLGWRLHRYEAGSDEVRAALERGYAAWPDLGHCLPLTSGSQALQVLKAADAPLAQFLLKAADWLDLTEAA